MFIELPRLRVLNKIDQTCPRTP